MLVEPHILAANLCGRPAGPTQRRGERASPRAGSGISRIRPLYGDRIVRAFPRLGIQPEKGELNAFPYVHRRNSEIDDMHSQAGVRCRGVADIFPIVDAPVHSGRRFEGEDEPNGRGQSS